MEMAVKERNSLLCALKYSQIFYCVQGKLSVCSSSVSEWFCCSSEVPMRSVTDISSLFRGTAGARTAQEDLWYLSCSVEQVSLGTRLWLQTGVVWSQASLDQWLWHVDPKQLPWHAAALWRCSIFYLPLSGVLNKTTDVQARIPQLLCDILLRAAWQWRCAWLCSQIVQGMGEC